MTIAANVLDSVGYTPIVQRAPRGASRLRTSAGEARVGRLNRR